ncbi:helix-turn-helix transcriptional regulator [Staphylococcus saprophyticus]|uniref:helix-turn-helix domain-containing protein n=1 Tax=Staphylococcus saprophyticus TaxID=29385 RepID=UPI0022EB11A4|nr:helix-turn-helix transcriptional regulator [Staphylococcus saprophyticus]MDK1673422.1 helix-turn-helix transcriptional regulator [Staphylococcus saprophyticus]MDW3873125.1 helix-turn-helix transcriptional regulator [Staphylococcus saprophyticus]MDW3945534.1 helix-turn-helix transcriptional regulator [Staphylococcus saprophyticus]MDW3950769.1 helix-turn-helix transcriptional regulator [Staphylococcus saprophyticus]MDW4025847.1 helix-turn-helix transcriptional regulator [Staphylococcus saprop
MTITINETSVKKAMFLKGYNLSDLSNETGVGVSYLSQIINGKKIPSPKLAKKMSEVLQVSVDELFIFEQKEA